MVGNDICNGREDTLNHMTSVEDFEKQTKKSLEYLEENLPKGSSVLLSGLADGRILFDTTGNLIHPVGEYNNDVKYSDFYDYLDCLGVSPCAGWLTTNSTRRELASQRAQELSDVAKRLAAEAKYENFKMGSLKSKVNIFKKL